MAYMDLNSDAGESIGRWTLKPHGGLYNAIVAHTPHLNPSNRQHPAHLEETMTAAPHQATPAAGKRKLPPGALKAYVASLTGTSLEYYDFAIYSVASALVFPKVFFPGNDEFVGLLLSFSTFAVGYLARPIGGVIFGRLGDKIGRKNVLVTTLLLIGIATVLIGVLPGYATIGLAAPTILVLLRLAQGIGVGGEWGGAVLLSSEFGDPRKRGFWSSAAQIGPPAGNLMANGVLAVLAATLSNEDFLSWGWRVAFLASAILVVFGLLIRLKLEETPVFKAIKAHGEQPKAPIKEVFTKEPRALVSAALCRVGPDVLYSLLTVFMAVYATKELGMTTSNVLTAILIGSAFQLVLIPAAGALTDRVNRRLVYGVAAVGTAAIHPAVLPHDPGQVGLHADRRHRDRTGVPRLHVRPAGCLHHRTVPGPAALCRQLAGLHPGRRDRRRHRTAGLHRPLRRQRQLVPDRRLPRGRLDRDGDRTGHWAQPAARGRRAAPARCPRLSGADPASPAQ